MWNAMISSSAGLQHQWHQWSPDDAGPDASSSASSTVGVFSPEVIMKKGWSLMRRTPSKSSRPFGVPRTLILLVIMMALTYLMFRCGQQLAVQHQVSRHLAAAPEPGAVVSCSGEGEKGDDEESGLRARVKDTLNALEELVDTAEQALQDMDPPGWQPAASILLSFALQELMAFAGFLDSELEGERQRAVRSYQAFRERLMKRTKSQYTRTGAGRAIKYYKGILEDALRPPSWGAFPSSELNKRLLQELTVMTTMAIEACRTAVSALAPSSGIHETGGFSRPLELLRMTRKARLGQLLATPELSRYMEEMRRASGRQGLYSDTDLSEARKAGPKPLEENIAEFKNCAGKLCEDLNQQMQHSAGSHSHAAPSTHPTGPRGRGSPYQPVQQPPAAAVQQRPPRPPPSVPFPLPPQARQPRPRMFPASLLQFSTPRPSPPSQGTSSFAGPPRASFPSGVAIQTTGRFPPGHPHSQTMTLWGPTSLSPFGVGPLPSRPPYTLQQTGGPLPPSSTRPGSHYPLRAHLPRGAQQLAPGAGAHRESARFYGHPLGEPAGSGVSEGQNEAPTAQVPPSGSSHDEVEGEGGES